MACSPSSLSSHSPSSVLHAVLDSAEFSSSRVRCSLATPCGALLGGGGLMAPFSLWKEKGW